MTAWIVADSASDHRTARQAEHNPGMVVLRSQRPDDLLLLTGADSPFDGFGPAAPRNAPAPCAMESDGALTVLTDDGQVAGEVSWHWQRRRWGPNDGSACPMLGIWLRPEHRGHGLGTAAQAELVDLLFLHTTTHRVEAHTDVANAAEQRALERAGLLREGITRGAQWRGGAYHDGVLYAVLRDDPRPSSS